MKRLPAVSVLTVRICETIRDLRQDHESWISIEDVHDHLGMEDLSAVDAAIAFAIAKGWLSVRGEPARHVLLNPGAP